MTKQFPVMKWHPETGDCQIFHAAADVPEGWLDQHPKDPKGRESADDADKSAKGADKLPMTKKAIVAALIAGNIEFAANGSAKDLYELLGSKLREHLTAQTIEIPEGADVPALLALANPV